MAERSRGGAARSSAGASAAVVGEERGLYTERIKRLRGLVAEQNCPALLVTNPVDVGYLTGFLGGDSYLLLDAAKPTLLSDFRYEEELAEVRGLVDVVIRRGAMTDALGQLLESRSVTRLGVQGEHMTLSLRQAIGAKARGLKLIETTGLVARLRLRKDAHEVGLIRKAIRIQQAAFEETMTHIEGALKKRGSISELEIAAVLESAMKSRGSPVPSFDTNVSARANGSKPHYRPGPVKHGRNRALLIDWGATYRGYHGDMTRVVCFGKWPAKIREIYPIVLEAHMAAAAALAAGVTTQEVDGIARGVIAAAGYGDRFGHGLGHGIGMNVHEGPSLSHMAEAKPLEPGMVVTIEPGIYLPGVGGVRIEDDYLITDKGSANLCSLPKSMDWATR